MTTTCHSNPPKVKTMTNALNTIMQRAQQALNTGTFKQSEWYTCPCRGEKCDGYGHLHGVDGRVTRCPEQRIIFAKQTVDGLARDMDFEHWVPPRLSELPNKINNFQHTNLYTEICSLCDRICEGNKNDKKNMIVCGGHGRGKTLMAMSLIRTLAEHAIESVPVRFPKFVSYFKTVGRQQEIESVCNFAHLDHIRLLVVDEMGREGQYGNLDHAREALQRLITPAWAARKYILLLTNHSRKALGTYLPSELTSRLSESAGNTVFIEEPFKEDLRQCGN